MKTQRNSGSSIVMVVVLIIVLVLVGTVGWLFYHSLQKTTLTSSSHSSTVSNPPKPPTDSTANWIKVTSATGAFSLKIPDGWNVQNWTSRDYLYAAAYTDLTYTAGKPAMVTAGDTNSIDSGTPRHFSVTGNPIAQKSVVAYPNAPPQGFGIVSGVAGEKYSLNYNSDGDGVKKGDKSYQYRFEGAKTLITVNYYMAVGESDQMGLVEKAIKTLTFE